MNFYKDQLDAFKERRKKIYLMHKSGMSYGEIAKKEKISVRQVYRLMKRAELE